MLNAMRKHAYSWGIRILLGLIVVVFMFWGIGSGFFNQVHPVASVDGQKILADEVDRQAENMRRSFQNMYGQQAADLLKHINLRQQAVEQIIDNRLIAREAERLGLQVSNDDLRRAIAANRAFQFDGQFDMPTYEAVLRENGLDPPEFEAMERTELTGKMLQNMVGQAVALSEAQARQEYNQRNEQLALAYIEVPSADFVARIHPTEDQVRQFYKSNGEQFREPERVKAAYIQYDPIRLGETVKPAEKDIADFYKQNLKKLFSYPDRVRARHILISASADTSAADKRKAKAQAEQVLAQLQKGADFAKLATQYSDDPGTRERGGDLGFFSRGQMIKPFEEAAFKLKPGQLTGVIETSFGYHIIKVEEVKPAHVDTLEQARPRIIELVKERAGRDAARNDLREDLDAALNGAKLKELAAKHGLEVMQTPLFAANEPIGRLGMSSDFSKTAFKLGKGEVGMVNSQGGGLFLVQVLDHQPSHIPALAEIESQVREALIRRDAESQAGARARELLKQIKHPADFDRVAAANHLTVHQTGTFDRSSSTVPTIGDFAEVTQSAGSLTQVPGVIGRVMVQGGNSYIIELVSRKPPSPGEWEKAEPHFKEELLQTMRSQAWESFLDGLKHRAQITVDSSALGGQPAESSM